MQCIKYYKDIDFIEIFDIQHKETIFKPKLKKDWDKKAKVFDKLIDSPYYDKFMEKIDLSGIESVLDIGCGNANLALKFLEKGIKVTGVDYSQGMIEAFKKNTKKYQNVRAFQKAWEDDWDDLPICDIVVISRSFEFEDLGVKEAIEKILSKTKKAVYLTYYDGNYLDDEILKFLNKDIVNRPEYILFLNVLYQMGIKAKLDFIEEESKNEIYSFDEFVRVVNWKLGELTDNDIKKLKDYYEMKKSQNKPLVRPMRWAYIYWKL